MFDDPSGAGVAVPFAVVRGRLVDPVSLSPYRSKMKKITCRPVCALSPGNAINWGSRFRQR